MPRRKEYVISLRHFTIVRNSPLHAHLEVQTRIWMPCSLFLPSPLLGPIRKALAGCERLRERCASLLCIAVAGATPASSASLNVGSHVLAFRA
ncbi:MAG: hypothetical protein AAGI08_14480, partial [Bacteroidota bacterium]